MSQKKPAILITGGSKRIGLALAVRAIDMGYSVVIHYRSSLEQAKAEFSSKPDLENRVFYVQKDLEIDPKQLIDEAITFPINLVGLVNCASQFSPGNLTDQAHFNKILNLNTITPLSLASRFAEKVIEGWIINMTDAHIAGMNSRFQNYRISKIILEELTRQMAFCYAPRIRVNALAPGAILPSEIGGKSEFAELSSKIPLKRTGDLKSICSGFEYLVKNEYLTGVSIPIDGGWHLT